MQGEATLLNVKARVVVSLLPAESHYDIEEGRFTIPGLEFNAKERAGNTNKGMRYETHGRPAGAATA